MNNLYTFNEFLNESYFLNESFKSTTLAQFIKEHPLTKFDRLPKGVMWDKIPDNEVILGSSQDPVFKKMCYNSDEYVVFWYSNTKQMGKYKKPSYRKTDNNFGRMGKDWSNTIDNSIYIYKGETLLTQGSKFISEHKGIFSGTTGNKYEKPLNGDVSVEKIYDDLDFSAIAIKYVTLVKYSAEVLRADRKEEKKDALALQDIGYILSKNRQRYKQYVIEAKLNKETKTIATKVEIYLNDLKKEIESLSKISLDNLVKFSIRDDEQTDRVSVDISNLKKLEKLANDYNDVSWKFNSYFDNYKELIKDRNSEWRKRRVEDKEEELLNMLK